MTINDKIEQLKTKRLIIRSEIIFNSITKSPNDIKKLENEYKNVKEQLTNLEGMKERIIKITKLKSIINDKLGFTIHGTC